MPLAARASHSARCVPVKNQFPRVSLSRNAKSCALRARARRCDRARSIDQVSDRKTLAPHVQNSLASFRPTACRKVWVDRRHLAGGFFAGSRGTAVTSSRVITVHGARAPQRRRHGTRNRRPPMSTDRGPVSIVRVELSPRTLLWILLLVAVCGSRSG